MFFIYHTRFSQALSIAILRLLCTSTRKHPPFLELRSSRAATQQTVVPTETQAKQEIGSDEGALCDPGAVRHGAFDAGCRVSKMYCVVGGRYSLFFSGSGCPA